MKKLIVIGILGAAVACGKDIVSPDPEVPVNYPLPVLPGVPFNYANQPLPDFFNGTHFNEADNTPVNNPVTNEGATLGRVLFYDKNLSLNKTISCGSCHQQEHGFSDPDKLSSGFENGLTNRHSMSLANSRYYQNGHFFWDQRAVTLEDQVLMPVQDAVEMGMTINNLVKRLEALSYYPPLFKEAFGSEEVTETNIRKALAQFIRSIISYRSRYDKGRAMVANQNMDFPNFTPLENRGKNLFLGSANCNACHGTDAFIAQESRNNGLDSITTDAGFYTASGQEKDISTFKVGSLKNIAVTAPYMHDGRFATLMEVIEHYNSGVQDHPNLSPPLRTPGGSILKLNLDEEDKNALILFLQTLTDEELIADEKFSDPFEQE